MSRSGYNDDCNGWDLIRWRGAVTSALRGSRGKQFLRELADAMDAMPKKILGADSLQTTSGSYCTLGVVGAARGIDLSGIDSEDRDAVGASFGIAPAMAAEIMFENDENGPWIRDGKETPEQRWQRMRAWVQQQLETAYGQSGDKE